MRPPDAVRAESGETRPLKLTPAFNALSELKQRLARKQAFLTIPVPDAHVPLDIDQCRREAARLLREYRRSGQPRHYRALLQHCSGTGLRIAMVAAANGADIGDVDRLTEHEEHIAIGHAAQIGGAQ